VARGLKSGTLILEFADLAAATGFFTAVRISVCERCARLCTPWAAVLILSDAAFGMSKFEASVILGILDCDAPGDAPPFIKPSITNPCDVFTKNYYPL
jgi:hypothetical protein